MGVHDEGMKPVPSKAGIQDEYKFRMKVKNLLWSIRVVLLLLRINEMQCVVKAS